jgi:nucleoside-diphosphate-sugar epimerase/carbamoylphosphate synthase large subunit
MLSNKYVIGISCIGSGVGQSVIDSCRLSRLPLYTVGLGTNPFAYGAYDCDVFDYVPTIYDANFVDILIEACVKHKVDLLIPGLDDEVLVYAKNRDKFQQAGILILAAGEQLIKLCRDKEKMTLQLNSVVDAFVYTYDRSSLEDLIKKEKINFPLIAKPRSGNASRGVKIIRNREDLYEITDKHIIQELAIPSQRDPNFDFYIQNLNNNQNSQVSEISVQVVLDDQSNLLGRMASYNKLNNGIPIEILPFDEPHIWKITDKLLPKLIDLGLVGPINIQGRLTDTGFKIFEINPRFTGITGLRALMGFNEVEVCIARWLKIPNSPTVLNLNHSRFGIRQTTDRSVPLERNDRVKNLYRTLNTDVQKKQKTILITGATGYLGQNLIKQLVATGEYKVWTLNRRLTKTYGILGREEFTHYDFQDLESGNLSLGNVDMVVHSAFARKNCTNQEIAESLSVTSDLFTRLAMHHVPALINISSQSVYGQEHEPLWTEETPVAPATTYAQAKYSTELMAQSLHTIHNQVRISSLRLSGLTGGQPGLVIDMLANFVNQAMTMQDIHIIGGKQIINRLDIRDAVNAVIALIQTNPLDWEPLYNVGADVKYSILDIANLVIDRVYQKTGKPKVKVNLEEKDIMMRSRIDCTKFSEFTGWSPLYTLVDTVDSLIDHLTD